MFCLHVAYVIDDVQVVKLKLQSFSLKQTTKVLLTWALTTAGVVGWPNLVAVNLELNSYASCILALGFYFSL